MVPGNAAESLLYQKLLGQAKGSPMPFSGQLTSAQIESVRLWLDQGAAWPEGPATEIRPASKHWAYLKPVRPEPPTPSDSGWIRNPIDRFVLPRLEKEGLEPSPEASKETLIRRLSLDLIGLPPSLEEVDAFLKDDGPNAYERLVDRLLASPHYGERWARPWLDLARYADTHGYIHDRRRDIWPYRDWVIQALNQDMPFDQFTLEQIAGDLLADATPRQKIATGFHRNTMINTEGGTDAEEYRVAAIFDRVDTTATVWLGSTIACARCHDHKYDPFTQKEYYQLFAFFNNTFEENNPTSKIRPHHASITLPPPDYLERQRREVEEEMVQLEATLRRSTPKLEGEQTEWESKLRSSLVSWAALDPYTFMSAGGAGLKKLEDGSLLAEGPIPARDTYLLVADAPIRDITAIRLETLTHFSLPHQGSSRSPEGEFLLTGFEVTAEPLDGTGSPQPVAFASALAEYEKRARFEVSSTLDGSSLTGWSIGADQDELRVDRQAIFLPKSPVGFPGGTRLTIRLRHESERAQQIVGCFRLSVTQEQDPARNVKLPSRVEELLFIPPGEQTLADKETLAAYYRSIAPSLNLSRDRLEQLKEFWGQLTSPRSLVMKELEQPRATHVFLKGSFLDLGEPVRAGVPAVLHPLPQEESPNRLTLARWLVSEDNPLVGRVTMNRLWAHHFGRPLVRTPEDLGSQGATPSHPALLDWLATEFERRKWSLKRMHRLIVASATYRQRSLLSARLLERDPYNELYARGPRFRMDAEMIRDNALSIGGLLSLQIHGPSVFPSQPEGLWDNLYVPDTWIEAQGPDRYRRGLYTFWKRIRPYPFYSNFDGPSRETTCVYRTRSTTPLQALNLLNDTMFLEAAQGLAGRMIHEVSGPAEERIGHGFRLCLGRRPERDEVQELISLFDDQLENFTPKQSEPGQVASAPLPPGPQAVDRPQFAAWTAVAQVLLNLDETITRP